MLIISIALTSRFSSGTSDRNYNHSPDWLGLPSRSSLWDCGKVKEVRLRPAAAGPRRDNLRCERRLECFD